jgi:hypothetical protein
LLEQGRCRGWIEAPKQHHGLPNPLIHKMSFSAHGNAAVRESVRGPARLIQRPVNEKKPLDRRTPRNAALHAGFASLSTM